MDVHAEDEDQASKAEQQADGTGDSFRSFVWIEPKRKDGNEQRLRSWTAVDGRVCKRCHAIESGNPYPLVEASPPALHPFCRCVLVTHQPLDALRFTKHTVEP